MNGVREEYSIKMKQTSKGMWYCDGLQVITEMESQLASCLDRLMIQVEGVLYKHNNVEEPSEWAKAAERARDTWSKSIPKPGKVDGEK